MTGNYCGHQECQGLYSCQLDSNLSGSILMHTGDEPPFKIKAWFRQHPDPDEDQEPTGSQSSGEDSDVIEKIPESTHQDDALDTLVSRASIPNLGALIKQGIKQGLIAPTTTYC